MGRTGVACTSTGVSSDNRPNLLHQIFGRSAGTLQADPISTRRKSIAPDNVKAAANISILGAASRAEQIAL
jgi:hypothetical protein